MPVAAVPGTRLADADSIEVRNALVFGSTRIRGASILAVILLHVLAPVREGVPGDGFEALVLFADSSARFAVPCFLVLSAFHLSLNPLNERPRRLYRRRLRLLAIPYVFYSGAYVLLEQRAVSGVAERWLWAVLTGTGYYHLWFVLVLLEFYLLHPFLRAWFRSSQHPGGWTLAALLVQIGWATMGGDLAPAAVHAGSRYAPAVVLLSLLSYVGYFLAGYYLHDHAGRFVQFTRGRGWLGWSLLGWLAISVMMAFGRATFLVSGSPQGLHRLPRRGLEPLLSLAALSSFTAHWRARKLSRAVDRILGTAGLYAYGVYFLHPLVIWLVDRAWRHGLDPSGTPRVFCVVAFPIVVVCSVYGARFLSRSPVGRYLT